MSESLQPGGLQHTRILFSPLSPGVYSNSCPLSRWCHPTISSSVVPFSSRLPSFPVSGSFPMSQFFASDGNGNKPEPGLAWALGYFDLEISACCCSVAQSWPTLWDPMRCSTPGFPVLCHLLELAQTHIHQVSDTIQPSYPLSSPSPLALNLSQHQGLF